MEKQYFTFLSLINLNICVFSKSSGQSHIPQCNVDGSFKPRQCHDTAGKCWCVKTNGEEIEGTMFVPGDVQVECSEKQVNTPEPEVPGRSTKEGKGDEEKDKEQPVTVLPDQGEYQSIRCWL